MKNQDASPIARPGNPKKPHPVRYNVQFSDLFLMTSVESQPPVYPVLTPSVQNLAKFVQKSIDDQSLYPEIISKCLAAIVPHSFDCKPTQHRLNCDKFLYTKNGRVSSILYPESPAPAWQFPMSGTIKSNGIVHLFGADVKEDEMEIDRGVVRAVVKPSSSMPSSMLLPDPSPVEDTSPPMSPVFNDAAPVKDVMLSESDSAASSSDDDDDDDSLVLTDADDGDDADIADILGDDLDDGDSDFDSDDDDEDASSSDDLEYSEADAVADDDEDDEKSPTVAPVSKVPQFRQHVVNHSNHVEMAEDSASDADTTPAPKPAAPKKSKAKPAPVKAPAPVIDTPAECTDAFVRMAEHTTDTANEAHMSAWRRYFGPDRESIVIAKRVLVKVPSSSKVSEAVWQILHGHIVTSDKPRPDINECELTGANVGDEIVCIVMTPGSKDESRVIHVSETVGDLLYALSRVLHASNVLCQPVDACDRANVAGLFARLYWLQMLWLKDYVEN